MLFTKTQTKLMTFFVSRITQRFSLREAARELGMHQALAYRASQPLIKAGLLLAGKKDYSLNYKENHQELAFFEHVRSKELLEKPENQALAMFAEDAIERLPYGCFSLIVFGSAVTSRKPRDIDILLVIERTSDMEPAERALHNISRNHQLNNIHAIVVPFESVLEMVGSRDEANVMNLLLDQHLILYGAELFYKLVKRGRK